MSDWYLYLIRCRDGTFYTGITTDVVRRLAEHQGAGNIGAKYVQSRRPLILVMQKKLGSQGLALKVERRVKKLSKAQKEKLIGANEYIEEIIRRVKKQAE